MTNRVTEEGSVSGSWLSFIRDLIIVFSSVGWGIWTVYVFWLKERPTYAEQFETNLEIVATDVSDPAINYCKYQVHVTILNTGNSPFDITDFQLKIWQFEFPTEIKEAQFLDFVALKKQPPVREIGKDQTEIFLRRYELKDRVSYYFDFLYPKLNAENYLHAKFDIVSPQSGLAARLSPEKYIFANCR